MNITTREDAIAFLKQVAAMSVKAGKQVTNAQGEDAKAGWGYVGILNGHTVKLATKFNERKWNWNHTAGVLPGACEALKTSILRAADVLGLDVAAKNEVAALLNGNKGLITRKVALAAVKRVTQGRADANLGNVIGNASADSSKADEITVRLDGLAADKRTFLRDLDELLGRLLPGEALMERRQNLHRRAENSIFFRNDKLTFLLPDQPDLTARQRSAGLKDILSSLQNIEKVKSDVDFRVVLEQLRRAIVTGRMEDRPRAGAEVVAEADKGLSRLAREMSEIDLGSKPALPAPTAPVLNADELAEPPGLVRVFEIFKARAGANPPTVDAAGKKEYADYHAWMMEAALKARRTDANNPTLTLADLTLEDVEAFIRENPQLTPDSTDAKIFKHINSQTAKHGLGSVYDRGLAAFLNDWNAEGNFNNVLVDPHGTGQKAGIFLTYRTNFQVGGTDVESLVQPLRTENLRNQLANFALTRLNAEGEENPLFQGLRFAVRGSDGNPDVQRTRFGQLVRQTILQNPRLLAEAQDLDDGATLKLPIYRIDMSDEGKFSIPAETYRITIPVAGGHGTRNLLVKPEVHHFRLPTDSATLEGGTWMLMSADDLARTTTLIGNLCGRVETAREPMPRESALAASIREDFNQLLVKSSKDGKTGCLYENYGRDMMRLGAKIALLCYRLGDLPSINCNGGRDRTGLMDVECKTLALWLKGVGPENLDRRLRDYDANTAEVVALRQQVRGGSQNDRIAREITLGDSGLLTDQVLGLPRKLRRDLNNAAVPDLPDPIRQRGSGLDGLYHLPQQDNQIAGL